MNTKIEMKKEKKTNNNPMTNLQQLEKEIIGQFEERFVEFIDEEEIVQILTNDHPQDIKDFIRQSLAKQREMIKEEIENLITQEILICHYENTPTSRLTSLAVKIQKLNNLL